MQGYPDFLSESAGYVEDAFVDAVDGDWFCPVCTAVCRDALTSVCCQRLFCRRCVDAWFSKGGSACPACGKRARSRDSFNPNLYIDRRVRSLTIRCPLGCDARGLLIGNNESTLQEHLSKHCPRRRVLCPNRCRASYAALEAAAHLERECINRPVSCRHGCQLLVNPADAYEHDKHCRGNRVPCPFACFETAAQQAAVDLPTGARRYYADSTAAVAASDASAAVSVLFDVLVDADHDWRVARAVRVKNGRVLVHYEHSSTREDEWLPLDDESIAPLNTFTAITSLPAADNQGMQGIAWSSHSPSRAAHSSSASPSPSAVSRARSSRLLPSSST